MQYRREVDGLRALAVLPVILFHAGWSWFKGGFVGVDVFFVISGYLITSILIEDIEKKQFSIATFYERRAKRILPALLVMLVVVFLLSALIYLPGQHKVVGQYVVTSILSLSNILLYVKGNDYFGLEHSSNPLFHTWSLGVEEQFYLVIPFLLWLVWRANKMWQLAIPVIIIALSLLVNALMFQDSQFNFYMVVSRAWELGFGMLAAVLKRQGLKPNAPLAWIGLGLVVVSIFTLPSNHPYLCFLLLVPVLGAFFIIGFSSQQDNAVGRLLSHQVLVFIGLISYSLYLWHVPLLIFINYLWGEGVYQAMAYYSLLAACAYLSYRYVERPYRQPSTPFLSVPQFCKWLLLPAAVTVSLTGLGVLGHVNGGFPNRSDFFVHVQNNNGWGLRCNGNTDIAATCSESTQPNIALLGNSYAMMYVNAVRNLPGTEVVQLTQDSCALGYVDVVQDVNALPCQTFYERAIASIKQTDSIHTVMLSSPFIRELSTPGYRQSFEQLLKDLGDKQIYVIGPTPKAAFSVGECLLKARLLKGSSSCDFDVDAAHQDKVRAIAASLASMPNVQFLDVTPLICPGNRCVMPIGDNDSMYVDAGHLSKTGSRLVMDKLMSKLNPFKP